MGINAEVPHRPPGCADPVGPGGQRGQGQNCVDPTSEQDIILLDKKLLR